MSSEWGIVSKYLEFVVNTNLQGLGTPLFTSRRGEGGEVLLRIVAKPYLYNILIYSCLFLVR